MFLTNAWAIAKEFPTTFDVPSKEQIAKIKEGTYCKLCFNDKERMWVKITEVISEGNFKGVLDNNPVTIKDLSLGDVVEFSACNVYSITE